jgi:capsid protein
MLNLISMLIFVQAHAKEEDKRAQRETEVKNLGSREPWIDVHKEVAKVIGISKTMRAP